MSVVRLRGVRRAHSSDIARTVEVTEINGEQNLAARDERFVNQPSVMGRAVASIGCGLPPVIADSPKSAAKQFALDDRSLFPFSDAQTLSEKIDYWVDHPAQLKEARLKYHDSSQKYRIEQSFEKLLEIYHSARVS